MRVDGKASSGVRPSRWRPGVVAVGAILVTDLLVSGASAGLQAPLGAESPTSVSAEELAPLPDPLLDGVEPEVREILSAQRARVQDLLERGDTLPAELARAYADLGTLYLAYQLAPAAETCLRSVLLLDPGDIRAEYHLGLLDLEQRRWDEAAKRFARVVERRPSDAAGWIRLGEAHLGRKSTTEAREAYARAASVDARASAAARYGLGRVALLEDDPLAASEHFEAALAAQPAARRIHYLLAQAYRRLGENEKAQEHAALYDEGEVSFPEPLVIEMRYSIESADFHLSAADRAFAVGQDVFAEGSYRRALELDPDEPKAHQGLASVLERRGDLEGALREVEAVVRLEPGDVPARVHQGRLLFELGRAEEAVAALEEALRLDPRNEAGTLFLASVYSALDRHEDALVLYERVLSWAPQHPVALLERPMVLEALGRAEEARSEMARVVELVPGEPRAHLNYATLLSEAGDLAAAEALLQGVLAAEGVEAPVRALAQYNLGVIEVKRGRDEPALERFAAALEADPELVAARFHRGNVLARRGRYSEAATDFASVVEREPDHLPAHLARATALALAGQYGEAIAALTEGLRAIPGEPNLIHALARLFATCPDRQVRDGERAVELATQVFRRTGILEYGETVALGYAEMGAFEDAVRWQRNLLRAAEETGDRSLVERLQANLERLERGERP